MHDEKNCPHEVVAAVRKIQDTMADQWAHVPYSVVACVLRDEFEYTTDEAHALIFEATMTGLVTLGMSNIWRTSRSDRTRKLCINNTEDSNA